MTCTPLQPEQSACSGEPRRMELGAQARRLSLPRMLQRQRGNALLCRSSAHPGSPKLPPPEVRRTSPQLRPQQPDPGARRHGHQGLPAATLLPGAPHTGAECS
jgi:hypothetical protein